MKLSRRRFLRSVTAAGLAAPFFSLRGQSALESNLPGESAGGIEVPHINLAGNENPFGPSPAVLRVLSQELPNSCRYPFREEVKLREEIAAFEGVTPENIVIGNGCDEILSLAGAAFGGAGTNMVFPRPTYLQLAHYAEKSGTHIHWVDHTQSMHHDLYAMAGAIDASTGLVYVCNPDTPSGTMLPHGEIEAFVREVSGRCPVFLDEVYLDLLDDFEQQTQVDLVRAGLPVMIGRSFSKLHALAGHRIGYAVTTPAFAERLGDLKMSSLNYLGVAAARASLQDRRFHAFSRDRIRAGRERFYALLDDLSLPYTPSHGNFVFHYTGTPIREFQDAMREEGFLVGRPFPPYVDWCRISIGTPQEMSAYEASMRRFFRSRG